jgi:hypothetical protein
VVVVDAGFRSLARSSACIAAKFGQSAPTLTTFGHAAVDVTLSLPLCVAAAMQEPVEPQ